MEQTTISTNPSWKSRLPSVIYITLGIEALIFLWVLVSGIKGGDSLKFIISNAWYILFIFLFPVIIFSIILRLPTKNLLVAIISTIIIFIASLFLLGNILFPAGSGLGALGALIIMIYAIPVAIVLGFILRFLPRLSRIYQVMFVVIVILFALIFIK